MESIIYDVIIVGGGLSGLVVAQSLHNNNNTKIDDAAAPTTKWLLLEARSVLGGRLLNDDEFDLIDLGGAWIWPQSQPRLKRLVQQDLDLAIFRQPDDPSSTRIVGGAVQIIRQISKQLPAENIHLNAPVTSCTLLKQVDNNDVVQLLVTKKTSDDDDSDSDQSSSFYYARRVVFAIPPKLVEKHIVFQPPLSPRKSQAMAACHTWMAGVTKVALVYPERFWDLNYSNMGLPPSFHNNKTDMEAAAPAFQVYDSSTGDGSIAALTFFCLASSRHDKSSLDDDAILAQQVARQMGRIWTQLSQAQAAKRVEQYTRFHVQRWPEIQYISENDKPLKIHPHPQPNPVLALAEWEGRLEFAGSETDQHDPGVMEGAIGAAHRVVQSLQTSYYTE